MREQCHFKYEPTIIIQYNYYYQIIINKLIQKFSTMDVLVPIPMKNAAKCDKQCELQNSANHQIFERKWRQRDILLACLFQCLRGFTLTLMWLNGLTDWRVAIFFFNYTCSLMKDARGDLSVQWSGHITRMWFRWKHRIINNNSRYHYYW